MTDSMRSGREHLEQLYQESLSTARKHGINAIDAIYNAFFDQPFNPEPTQAL
ncbi:MAG: hypothetical protein OXF76_19910 [Caldilineaceae bacterium]|nr:hypothetical protein [Caldilineaceae bacterium]